MPFYETVFIVRPDLTDTQVKELTASLTKVIEDDGGKITKQEDWGLRTLAYRINKSRKGRYLLLEIDAPSAAVIEIERLMRLSEDVMRSLTIRLDKLTDGPSIIMNKPKREDRDDRGSRDNKYKKEAA